MKSLPFYIDNMNGGFMKADGVLRVEGQTLVFEFHVKDAILEAYKSDLKEIRIDLQELDLIEFKKGIFIPKLILHGKTAKSLADLPGDELTERTLKIKRKHRNIAASIASNLNLRLSEEKLRQLED